MDELAIYNNIFKLIDFNLLEKHLTAFSIEKKLLAIAKNNKIYIYDTKTKKQIYTIESYDGNITYILFIPNSQHILAATTNGRVIAYNYKNSKYNIRIYSWIKKYKTQLPTKINTITIKNNLLVLGTLNGEITIINLNTYEIIYKYQPTNAAITALCFDDKNELIISNSFGEIFIKDLQYIHKQKTGIIHTNKSSQLLHIKNSDFIIINSNTKYLSLFNIKNRKIEKNNYLSFHDEISYIEITKNSNLLVVLKNREIMHIELEDKKYLESLRLHNMIHEAYDLVEHSPQLLNTKEYRELEKLYKSHYINAVKALQNNNEKKAHDILDIYTDINSKKDDIKALFVSYKNYEKLQILYMQQKYTPAYALSNKFIHLQYSKEYIDMEKTYQKAYSNAQKMILKNDYKTAKEFLSPYLNITSKKDAINLILKNNKEFLLFLDAIKNKDYIKTTELIKKYPNFSLIPTYKDFINNIYNSLNKINKYINAANFDKAQKLFNELENINLIKEDLSFLKKKYKTVNNLIDLYKNNNFNECYELLDTYPEMFLELKLAKLLEKHWNKIIKKCEKYALYGQIKGIKKILGTLILIKTRSKIIGELLRLSFLIEIANNINNQKYKSAENFIYSYIDIFGTDTSFNRIMQEYEKKSSTNLAITQEQQNNIPRDRWLHNKLVIE